MSLPIDHARLPRPGDIFAQKYRLECILGSGGMGVVFGATHLFTHKHVAIKWLAVDSSGDALAETTQRFMREARVAGEFHHPNVVQVYDVGESQGSFFMVMEWLEGESLAACLEREQRLSFQDTLDCLIPCMQAIQRAHDVGIIHRDIKPANIFLCQATPERPALSKVLDFGISKRITGNIEVSSFITQTGMLIGTPHYLAPEQLRARPQDRRTDIYGFGVLLYETLAGCLPFTADNFGDLVVQISTGTPRSLRELVPDLPLGVEQVVAKAMARNPDERFDTLHELIASLEALDPAPLTAATLPQLRVPTSVSPITLESESRRIQHKPDRRRALALLGAAALSAAVTGIFLRQRPRGEVAPQSLVRPRALPPAAAAQPKLESLERSTTLPAGTETLTRLPNHPVQAPQLDASVDSGRPVPVRAARPAGATAPAAPPEPPRITAKPPSAPRIVTAPPQAQPIQPPPAAPPEPVHDDITSDPNLDSNPRQHNPLHMDIQ